jgi:hypothetical protein
MLVAMACMYWIDPGAKPGLRGKKEASNDLNHDTALEKGLEQYETTYSHCATSRKYGRSRASHMLVNKSTASTW